MTTHATRTARPDRGRVPGTRSVRLGAVALVLLSAGTVVLLTYTLADLGWQQRFGAWNYLAALGLLVATLVPLRLWRPDSGSVPAVPAAAVPVPRPAVAAGDADADADANGDGRS